MIPLLPNSLIDLIDSPFPYIIGLRDFESCKEERIQKTIDSEISIVWLDENKLETKVKGIQILSDSFKNLKTDAFNILHHTIDNVILKRKQKYVIHPTQAKLQLQLKFVC